MMQSYLKIHSQHLVLPNMSSTSTHAMGNILDLIFTGRGNKHQTYFMPSGTLPVGSQASVCQYLILRNQQ